MRNNHGENVQVCTISFVELCIRKRQRDREIERQTVREERRKGTDWERRRGGENWKRSTACSRVAQGPIVNKHSESL